MPRSLVVATDGYCAPNPGGLATWAFVVETNGMRLFQNSGEAAPAPEGTSDLAEWRAAFEALAWLSVNAQSGERVSFRNDNARVVRALANEAPVPSAGEERRLAQECRRLWNELFARDVLVSFARVPRWENAVADALASEAHARASGAAPGAGVATPPAEDAFDLPPSRRGNR